jgi:hypothetical protein
MINLHKNLTVPKVKYLDQFTTLELLTKATLLIFYILTL